MTLTPLTPEQAVAVGRLAEPFTGIEADDLSLAYHVHTDRLRLTMGDTVHEIHGDGTALLVEAGEPLR